MNKIFDGDPAGLVPLSRAEMLQLSVLILRFGDVALRSLRSLMPVNDVNTGCLKKEFKSFLTFKGLNVSHPNDRNYQRAQVFSEQFFIFLANKIECRQDDNRISSSVAALNLSNWMKTGISYMEIINFSLYTRLSLLRLQPVGTPQGIP